MGDVVTYKFQTNPAIPFEEAIPRLFSNLEGRHVVLNCGDCYVMDADRNAGIWLASQEGNLVFEVVWYNRTKVEGLFPWVESVLGVKVSDKEGRDWDLANWPLSPKAKADLDRGIQSCLTEPLVYIGSFSQFADDGDWLEEVYRLVQEDETDDALDALFEGVGNLCDAEKFDELENSFAEIQLDLLNEDLLVGILMSTHIIADKLPSRKDLIARVRGALQQRMPLERVARIMHQISCDGV